MEFVCLCLRIPKCGSASLAAALNAAFMGRQCFYLPHTLNLEGSLSALQNLRFHRTRARNLFRHYGTTDIGRVYGLIAKTAREGDFISGGHIDLPSVRQNIPRKVRAITIFREPVERCRSEYDYLHQGYFKKLPLSRFDASAKQQAAGRYSFRGYLDFLLDHADIYGNLATRYLGWDGEEELARFFARHIFHSGVLEEVETFARELGEKVGSPVPFPHDNATGRSHSTMTAGDRSRIERLCPHDFTIYEWRRSQLASTKSRAAMQPLRWPAALAENYSRS
jgi:hypothetical protein